MFFPKAIFPQTFRVRYGEANQYGKLMIHHLFNYLQEIAFNHADFLANSVEGKAQWDLAVVWTRIKIVMTALPAWKEDVHIYTWISPLKDNEQFAFRNFSLSADDGYDIGYGYGSLLFFDLKTRKAIPIPEEVKNYPTDPQNQGRHRFSNFTAEVNAEPSPTQTASFQDLDIYRHVNNIIYVEWALQHVNADIYKKYDLTSLEIYFLKELRLGQTVCIQTEYKTRPNSVRIVHLIYLQENHQKIAQLRTEWRPKTENKLRNY